MIELPRAALKAGEIAETAEFFSFGTNDLTQTAFGISRDDAASFLGIYTAKGILPADPFVSIDRDGVGELDPHRRRARPQGAAKSQARHLRRARRRSGFGRVLPRGRARLCVVLAVPRADRAACRGAGGAGKGRRAPPRKAERRLASGLGEKFLDVPAQIGDRHFHRLGGIEHDIGRHVCLGRGAGDVAEHFATVCAARAALATFERYCWSRRSAARSRRRRPTRNARSRACAG